MIYLEEVILDKNSVVIKLNGTLDQTAIPAIKEACDDFLKQHYTLHLDLEKLIYITREGRSFLNNIKKTVKLINIPDFMQLADEL